MVRRNTNDDNDDDVGGLMEKAPHFITVVIAIGGLIAAYFMTIGDFRMKDAELTQRVTYLESKVDHIEISIEQLKGKLDNRFPMVDQDRADLRKDIDDLKQVLKQIVPTLKK